MMYPLQMRVVLERGGCGTMALLLVPGATVRTFFLTGLWLLEGILKRLTMAETETTVTSDPIRQRCFYV